MSYDDDDDYLCHVVQTVEDVFARFFRLDFRLLLVFFGRLKAQSYVYVYIQYMSNLSYLKTKVTDYQILL